MEGTSIVWEHIKLSCEMRLVSSFVDREVIILRDDQIEFTQAWKEKKSSALINEEWDHIWKFFIHANNPWGVGFGRRLRGRKYISFVPNNLSTLLLLVYKSLLAKTDIWTTGNLLANKNKNSRDGRKNGGGNLGKIIQPARKI